MMLPPATTPSRAATDARRVLAVLHSLRVMAWRHTDEAFPGLAVINSRAALNSLTKWEDGRERRLSAADRLSAELGFVAAAPPALFVGSGLSGAATAVSEALKKERTDPITAWAAMPAVFIPVEPVGLKLTPFCEPAPETLAGKFTARQHRAPLEAGVLPPAVFELSDGPRTGPLLPRQHGLTVHDSVSQWVHAPGYIKFRQPEVVVQALAAAASRGRGPSVDLAELVADQAVGFARRPPSESYDAVVPRRAPGTPFEPLAADAALDACWTSRQANPRSLLRGFLRQAARGGGRPRRPGACSALPAT